MFYIKDHSIYIQLPSSAWTKAKDILNGEYVSKYKMWKFPHNLHVMREIYDLFTHVSNIPEFMESLRKMQQVKDKFLSLKALTDAEGEPRLRPYQRADVHYLKHLPSAGIFNEPRTGKTPTTITLLKEKGFNSVLIVVPASLLRNWEKEMKVWYPTMNIFILAGTPKKRKTILEQYADSTQKRCLIVSKDTLKLEVGKLEKMGFMTMVVDESHFLRNSDTTQSKAVYKMGTKCRHRYALSGTPAVKSSKDIFGILHFLYPDKYKSKWQFIERYFEKGSSGGWSMDSYDDVKQHRRKEFAEMIGLCSAQRKRKEVMAWLPDKDYQTIPLEMPPKQRKLYDTMLKDFYVEDGDTSVDTMNVLSQLTRLRQLCLDPRLLGFEEQGIKSKAILEYLDSMNEPVIIMSMFTSYLHLLSEDITNKRVGMIHGSMSSKEKFNEAEKFQAGETDVLLCNIISAGLGFTLDKGEVIIFPDRAWNPAEQEQAEDRITPTDKSKVHPHSIMMFTVEDSIDARIEELLQEKKNLISLVNEGGAEAIRMLIGR